MQQEVRVLRKKDGRVLHVPIKVALSSDFRKKGNVIDDPNFDVHGNKKTAPVTEEVPDQPKPAPPPTKKPRKKKAATTKPIDPLKD